MGLELGELGMRFVGEGGRGGEGEGEGVLRDGVWRGDWAGRMGGWGNR